MDPLIKGGQGRSAEEVHDYANNFFCAGLGAGVAGMIAYLSAHLVISILAIALLAIGSALALVGALNGRRDRDEEKEGDAANQRDPSSDGLPEPEEHGAAD